jgi:periplasmic protein TonB
MFEQSLLLDHAAGKKTVAMAASLTAQTLLVGVLIAIPLIFSERLPDVRLFIPLSLPLPPPPPRLQQVQNSTSSSTSHNPFASARIYTPTHMADLSQIPDVGLVEAPPQFSGGADNGVPGGTGVPSIGQFFREPIPQAKPRAVEAAPAPAKPVPIGGDVQAAKLVKKVVPVYPPLARQARVSGTVQLVGVIAKDGTIQQLQVVSGHPLLVKAALDAVRQWIYRPTLLNGQAVEVIAPIDVIFTLGR